MNNRTSRWKMVLMNVAGIILAGNNVYGLNPIGMGFSTAMYSSGSLGIVTLLCMILGMINNFEIVAIVKYGSAFLLFLVLSKLIEKSGIKVNEYANAAICLTATFLAEIADFIMDEQKVAAGIDMKTMAYLGTTVVTAVFAGALSIAFGRGIKAVMTEKLLYTNEEMFSMAVIVGLALYGINGKAEIPEMLKMLLLFFALFYAAYKFGAGMGAIVGASLGIVFCMWNNNAEYLGIFCLFGIVGGIFRELGRIISAASVICACVTVGLASYPIFVGDELMKGVLGAAVIFIMLPKNVVYRFEENVNDREENNMQRIFEERLLNAARAIERLSKSLIKPETFRFANDDYGSVFAVENAENVETAVDEKAETVNQLWKNKFDESRNIMSDQLNQISKIIEEYSREEYDFVKISAAEEEFIRHKLKVRKVHMDKIAGIENSRNKREYLITAKCDRGITVGSREIADIVSEAFGKRYMPSRNCRKVISNEFSTTTYVEEANFYVMHGAARMARGESGISGDNYSLRELENGQVLMGLSDGMGYGASACLESETVIELLEQLLDSGFDGDAALKMINSVMVMNSEDEHPATLDYGVIDLHSGVCDIVKIGAATTFVKRGNWVETIKSTSMPLGMFSEVDYDSTTKKLYDGDMVIMVSDGVVDALDSDDNDKRLVEIIRNAVGVSPKEIADSILKNAVSDKSRLTDDMTVLVTGIWENSKKVA